jgi:uncharacterized repeat protein (TIGR03803 family)
MQSSKPSPWLRSVSALTLTLSLMGAYVSAQETALLQFNNNNGNEPIASLIIDGAGNLYGSTFYGGATGEGTEFKLTP